MRSLFIICCFVIGGCTTTSELATRDVLEFEASETTVLPASQVPSFTPHLWPSGTQLSLEVAASPFDSVAQQFDELIKWRKNCGHTPKACDIEKFILPSTSYGELFTTMMTNYAKNNIHSKPGRGQRIIKVQSIEHDKTNLIALVHGCITDSVVLYMDNGVFNDRVSSSLATWTMQWQDDHWYWINHHILKKIYDSDLCDS